MTVNQLKAPTGEASTSDPLKSALDIRTRSRSRYNRRFGFIILVFLFYASFRHASSHSMTTKEVDWSRYTDSIFIPFIYPFGTTGAPQVRCSVGGVDIEMPVDTGSTGLLIGAPILPTISKNTGTPAHHFFTSSNILYVGRLVDLLVTFHGRKDSYATVKVPVLIVDKSWRCPWYDTAEDGFLCPVGPNGEQPVERDTFKITYMGVGFGRNAQKDGMPIADPKANPFLNIGAIDGVAVSEESMRTGYVFSKEGIYLGLTLNNTKAFVFEDLEPGLSHSNDTRDWSMAKMCYNINTGVPRCGTVLVDSGIPQMYIRAEDDASLPIVLVPNPNKDGHARYVRRLKNGTQITVGFPKLGTASLSYSFVVGKRSTSAPSYVVPEASAPPPFINTGRNFFFEHSIAFDAIGGRFGVLASVNASPSSWPENLSTRGL